MKPIGILGGMGAFASLRLAEYAMKRAVSQGASRDSDFPKLLLYNIPVSGLDPSGMCDAKLLFRELRAAASHMETFGCCPIIIACASAHSLYAKLQSCLHVPILNLVELGAAAVTEAPVAILCSDSARREHLYEGYLSNRRMDFIYPNDASQSLLRSVIEYAMRGDKIPKAKGLLETVVSEVHHLGAKSVLLGCTELGCVCEPESLPLTAIDAGIETMKVALEYHG